MPEWLNTLTPLSEEWSWNSSIRVGQLTSICTFNSKESDLFSWALWATLNRPSHIQMHM